MQLLLTEEQEMLSRTARELLDARAPVSATRALLDAGSLWDEALWQSLCELGWPAILIDEAHDGFGLGLAELIAVMEPLGRNLTPTPLLSLALAAPLLAQGDDQVRSLLPRLASGELVVAVAWHEPFLRNDLSRIQTQATPAADGGWHLTGEKTAVLNAAQADAFIVAARTPKGSGLFLVRDGAAVTQTARLDRRDCGRVQLVDTPAVAVIPVGGDVALRAAMDRASVALCAEMLGGMEASFEMTLSYLKTRHQFGSPIGSFQALQHRAARMFIEIELCRSAVLAAALVADQEPARLPGLASIAKARCNETFRLVARETVQMHGGIGVTEEHDAGLYLKRARVAAQTFGTAAWHRDRWARLRGY